MSDQERIQGTWTLVSGERGGTPLTDQMLQDVKLIFAGDRLATRHRDRNTETTFTLASNETPKAIDLNMGGNVGKGIYQLDGDTLKIAHGVVGDARPDDFPKPGSGCGLTVLILKRETA
ncbi:MAG: TIGR03067 domain-containing protein [Planctomycetaceae bacterium]